MKAPSYAGFKPASASASLAKRRNHCVDTAHELLLRSALWRLGLRFRKNVSALPGKPDIVFASARVAVFCDGDFWHGRNWRRLSAQLRHRANPEYWCQKIRSNMERDRRTTGLLEELGWCVVRLWEGEIRKDPAAAALQIQKAILGHRGALCAS